MDSALDSYHWSLCFCKGRHMRYFTADSPISFITFPRYTKQGQGVSFAIWDGKATRWEEKKVIPQKIFLLQIPYCCFHVDTLLHGPFGSITRSPKMVDPCFGGLLVGPTNPEDPTGPTVLHIGFSSEIRTPEVQIFINRLFVLGKLFVIWKKERWKKC